MPGKPKPMLNRPRGKVSDLRKKFNPRTGEETNKPGGKDPRTIYKPEAQIPPERQMRTGGRLRIGTYQNPTSERSKESIDNYVRGMRKNRSFQYKKNDRGKIIKIELNKGGLSAKQKKIAAKAPPPDKIDAKDFAVLKAEKAKGRGMGLQDESIKPGKVQKAVFGKMIKSAGKSIGRLFGGKQSATATPGAVAMSGSGQGMGGMLPKLLQKAIDDGIIKPASKGRMMKAKYGKIIKAKRGMSFSEKMTLQDAKVIDKKTGKTHLSKNQLDDYLKNQKDPKLQKMGRLEKKYIQQRPGMAPKSLPVAKNILKAAKATRYGKIALGIAGAALGAKELLKSKMKKEDKKMGGGMAKKYSVGGGTDMGAKRDIDDIPSRRSRQAYAIGESMRDRDRLTTRDIQEATKALKPSQRKSRRYAATPGYLPKPAIGKMGGGMMNKPMGINLEQWSKLEVAN